MKKAIALVFMIIAMLIVTMLPKPVLSTPLGWKYFDNVISTLATLGTTTITTATITTGNVATLAISDEVSYAANTSYSALRISSEIVPTDSFYVFVSTGDNVSTATPQISTTTATSGQRIMLLNSGTSSYTFGDTDSVSGSLLELRAASREVDQGDILEVVYYGGKWYEIGFYNND